MRFLALAFCPLALLAQTNPLLPENSVTRVSEHVYAIIGWPNVAIVVGDRATLVVDTGMGQRNGAVVMREVEKLAKTPNLYLTTTHFHPEHSSGEPAFPPRTVILRPTVQQEEMNARNPQFLEMFGSRSAQMKGLLAGVKFRTPDITFEKELKLDLGGVTARLMWTGGGHTKGDELIFVEPDSALISGDLVQNKQTPNMPNEDSSVKAWIASVDQVAALKPRYVVPDHGPLGDGSLLASERAFLVDVQSRAAQLKREGKSADDAGAKIADEFKVKYAGWDGLGAIPNAVKRAYAE
jgi:glyoxylase-like metal-dependent hydrolase (beta-lactamase superfamily II)